MKHFVELMRVQLVYDLRPWLCFMLGLYAFYALNSSSLALLCGGVLEINAMLILYMRNSERYDDRRVSKVKY